MKQSTYKRLVALLCAVIVLTGVALGVRLYQKKQGNGDKAVTTAADFTVTDSQGNEVSLSDFVGKPVVVNFWASWCGPCKSELPYFQTAWETYGDRVEFLMVNLSTAFGDSREDVERLMASGGFTFPVYYDTYSEAVNAYQITAVPLTIFIDSDGALYRENLGMMTRSDLMSTVSALLSE